MYTIDDDDDDVGLLLTVSDHFAPVGGRGPETTKLTSLSGNQAQAFTFMSSTWILSRKTVKLYKIHCTAC